MVSERLNQILRSKTNLTEEEIGTLNEREGWAIIYELAKLSKEKTENKREGVAICFTGFLSEEKNELVELAKSNGMHHAHGVTESLIFLCCGTNPGAKKVEAAKNKGVVIINKQEFIDLLDSGDLTNVKTKKIDTKTHFWKYYNQ